MVDSKKIEYKEYTVLLDYYDENNNLIIVVKDRDGFIIEGINISDDKEEDFNPNLN